MTDFNWTNEMTEYAVNNVKSVSYAFSKPIDQLRTIEYILHNNETASLTNIRNLLNIEHSQDILEFLTNINVLTKDNNLYKLSTDNNIHSLSGFYTGIQIGNILNARVIALLGDSITTDHISPAGRIKSNSLTSRYLRKNKVKSFDFNTN